MSRLLSDISIYALGFGILALLLGTVYTLGRRIPGPDPNDPDPHQRYLAVSHRVTNAWGQPMLIGGVSLLVLAAILFIASRFV